MQNHDLQAWLSLGRMTAGVVYSQSEAHLLIDSCHSGPSASQFHSPPHPHVETDEGQRNQQHCTNHLLTQQAKKNS